MQKRVVSATKKLWEAIEAQGADSDGASSAGMIMPPTFLRGLRKALTAGLTCEQLVSFLWILTGIYEIEHDYDGDELIERTAYVVGVMQGDMDYLNGQKEIGERRVRIRDSKKNIRKKFKKK